MQSGVRSETPLSARRIWDEGGRVGEVNYLDLFSGIGGFALGAYWAGWRFDRHYFSEIDSWCCKLYRQRFPDAIPLGDITSIDGSRLASDAKRNNYAPNELRRKREEGPDAKGTGSLREGWVISGGFPCQDISVAGKGAGLDGARSGLWFEYARLIGEIRPRYAIMENVGALTRRGLDRVLGSLAEIGYDAEWSDIRASDVGAPHRRERIWIVAYPSKDPRRERQRFTSCFVSNTASIGSSESGMPFDAIGSEKDSEGKADRVVYERIRSQWKSEPDVGRVANGIPSRMDRLKGLGNAIVPQIAEMIFRQLAENAGDPVCQR